MAGSATQERPGGDETAPRLTQDVARWCAAVELDRTPAEVRAVARQCLLDWIGVTIAGARDEAVQLLVDELAPTGSGACTLLGRAERARAVDAALVNGVSAHVLDYDDTHMALPGHPTTPVLGALLAVAEDRGIAGPAFLRALICGLEAHLRLGRLAQPDHYERGWHATATMGTVGAAVACAEALGLTDERRRHAIGIAVCQAAGLKSMFGTMSKPFQVGKAAANGALAARLAQRGLTSNPDALEDRQGLLATYAPAGRWRHSSWPRTGWEVTSTLFKHHASCYFTHAGIEAAASLRLGGVVPEDVARLRLVVHPANLDVCNIREPRTGLEGKFSMTATAAMGLLGMDTADPAGYSESTMVAPDLVALRDRVTIECDDGLARTRTMLTAELTDGSVRSADADSGIAETDLDRQQRRLEGKFRRLVAPVLGAAPAEQLIDLTRRVQDLDSMTALTGALRGEPAPVG